MTTQNLNPINERGEAGLADRKAAEAKGFDFAGEQPWFAYGTALIQAGEDAFIEQRARMLECPLATDMVSAVAFGVGAEQRRDYDLKVDALRFTPDGMLRNGYADLQAVKVTDLAWRQLLVGRAEAPAAAGSYLPTLPNQIAIAAANHHLANAQVVKKGKAESIRTMLRTRVGANGQRVAYAALSPGYGRVDANAVAEALAKALHPTARGKFTMGDGKWQLTAQFGSSEIPVVGDIFTAAVVVSGADNGTQAIRVKAAVEQARCVNLTRIGANLAIDSIIHRGSTESLVKQITAALATANDSVSTFAERWSNAAVTNILDNAFELGAQQVFAYLVGGGHVTRPSGLTVEEFVGACVNAYGEVATEYGGLTQRAINYALTRAAQKGNPWAAATVEEEAGELLYNYVTITEDGYNRMVEEADGSDLGKLLA